MDKDLIILELNDRWGWRIPFGWIPIIGPTVVADTEIYHADYFEFFEQEITEAIAHIYGITEVYELAEDGQVNLLSFADCAFCYDGLERLYTDEHFRFVLYFSHESSVTAGGRELLQEIHRIWPEYQNHFWQNDHWNHNFHSGES